MQPLLINGKWTSAQNPKSSFRATNPANKAELERDYPVSTKDDVDAIVAAGYKASLKMAKLEASQIADFLEAYADSIDASADALAKVANQETGLPVSPRLKDVEIPRTTNQLRQAAAAARAGQWTQPTIDTATNIRSMRGPLGGPVVVFGPNNFPFAFNGVSGGDFAAAIAAGNPVIAKAHPSHPHTSQLLAEIALNVIESTHMPQGTVQLFYQCDPEVGLELVAHPMVGAVAFTGSRPGGLALKAAADRAGKPIYLEMSSVNPVVILPEAIAEKGGVIAQELQGSCTLAAGQFCTKPGLIAFVDTPESSQLLETLTRSFEQAAPGTLLSENGVNAVEKAVKHLVEAGATIVNGGSIADSAQFAYRPTLLRVSGKQFLQNPQDLQSEAFGPVALVVRASDLTELESVIESLEGNLTGGIYSAESGADDEAYDRIAPILRRKVGRLLNDKVPTGVAVSSAMNHGGPFPATGHPGFTAVGFPASLVRFGALHSYDNVRQHRLPKALRDENPNSSLLRLVDGTWTHENVTS